MARGMGRGYGYGRGRGDGSGFGYGWGKGSFSGYSCVKFVFFGFNVIFWLLGCAILGIGIWLQVSKGAYAQLAPNFAFLSATALCIAAGVLVLIVGFFGCCGAIMENQCMLLTYFILVVLIFMTEVVAGALMFVYNKEIEHVVQEELVTGIKTLTKPGADQRENDGLRSAWTWVQTSVRCCGVHNYTDWLRYEAVSTPLSVSQPGVALQTVPPECCVNNVTVCVKGMDMHKGCLPELKTLILREKLYIVGIVGISIIVIQLLGLVAAMAMFCCLRTDKYYDE